MHVSKKTMHWCTFCIFTPIKTQIEENSQQESRIVYSTYFAPFGHGWLWGVIETQKNKEYNLQGGGESKQGKEPKNS